MFLNSKTLLTHAFVFGTLALVGCGAPTIDSDAGLADSQTPPMGTDAEISAWIAGGAYKAWKCEAAAHDARSPSPHGRNRICNNAKLTGTSSGNYPAGAASVKELHAADGGTEITGYAIGLKTAGGASTPGGWYWYEKDKGMVVANGAGDKTGNELTVCTGCHQGAGTDAMHSGRDFVYTQVP